MAILEKIKLGDELNIRYEDGDDVNVKVVDWDYEFIYTVITVVNGVSSTKYSVGQNRKFKISPQKGRKIKLLSQEELNIKPKSMLKVLSQALKRLFSPELQTMYKAGFLNDDATLTSAGTNELLDILRTKFSEELTARAKEIVEEQEKK